MATDVATGGMLNSIIMARHKAVSEVPAAAPTVAKDVLYFNA